MNRFTQPIAAANVVTEPDNVIVPALATAGPITGNIADDRPEDDGMNTVSNEITMKIINIAPIAGIFPNIPPSPSAIMLLNPDSFRVTPKPLARATMNATPMKSAHPFKNTCMKCGALFQLIAPTMTDPIKNKKPASNIPNSPIGAIDVKNGNVDTNQPLRCLKPGHWR